MKNWKTTLGGCLGAVGVYLQNQTGWVAIVGQILAALGIFLVGATAKDNNVTGGSVRQ